jgi:hypothetical protein
VKKYLDRVAKEGDPRNVAGGMCRRCGAVLASREHLVDLAGMDAAGICSCEYWQIVIRKELERLPAEQRMCHENKCAHIPCAQIFAFQLSLKLHEMERLKNGHGRKEEDAA